MAMAVVEDRLPRFEGGETPARITFPNLKPYNTVCVSTLENRNACFLLENDPKERQWRLIGLRGLCWWRR
jgi:hypothetical protein